MKISSNDLNISLKEFKISSNDLGFSSIQLKISLNIWRSLKIIKGIFNSYEYIIKYLKKCLIHLTISPNNWGYLCIIEDIFKYLMIYLNIWIYMYVKMTFRRKKDFQSEARTTMLMDKHENSILVEDMKYLPSTTLQLENDIEFLLAVKVPWNLCSGTREVQNILWWRFTINCHTVIHMNHLIPKWYNFKVIYRNFNVISLIRPLPACRMDS